MHRILSRSIAAHKLSFVKQYLSRVEMSTGSSLNHVYAEKNSVTIPCASSSHDELSNHAPGPYTVMRVDTSKGLSDLRVFRFTQHVSRIVSARKALLAEDVDTLSTKSLMGSSITHAITNFALKYSLDHDLRVLFLLTPKSTPKAATCSPTKADVITHVAFMPALPTAPVALVAANGHRDHAEVKDSKWADDSKPLELLRRSGEDEVVMVHNDECLEGLTSNFFAINKQGHLQTAFNGVLNGTVRELVLLAAQAENIPVDEHPPLISEASTWQGCAISSTSRLLLPGHSIRIVDNAATETSYMVNFPTVNDGNSIIQRLARRVRSMYTDQCESISPQQQ